MSIGGSMKQGFGWMAGCLTFIVILFFVLMVLGSLGD